MKKKIVVGLLILLVLSIGVFFLSKNERKAFYLDEEYYKTNSMEEIKLEKLNQLIENKKTFALFVYQPMCVVSSDFENVLNEFLNEYKISIKKIAFSDIKDSKSFKKIQYYPSFVIYHNGKMVAYLDASKDNDVPCFTSKDGFKDWFLKYVKIMENKFIEDWDQDSFKRKEEEEISLNLENITRKDGKVNIYFFYGKGCPHCEEEFKFLESIKEEYGKYYQLYTFETWYNKDNAKNAQVFGEKMNDKVTGVPYTIIGSKSFLGFGEKSKKSFIEAIIAEHNQRYDIYFDKIKK